MKLSDSPVDVHRSLLLGEHNEDIYGRELGRDDQLASLKAKGDSCRSASCDHRRVPTSVDKTDITSKFQEQVRSLETVRPLERKDTVR
jgi:hypothetical protein